MAIEHQPAVFTLLGSDGIVELQGFAVSLLDASSGPPALYKPFHLSV
ncbi:MAG: hypothetical protein U5K35_12340 [Rhodohalobacter sp.]|nr:hypothetical protein [Rhodohalobacter sp.]